LNCELILPWQLFYPTIIANFTSIFNPRLSDPLTPDLYIEMENLREARTKIARFKGELEVVEDVLRNFDEEIKELR
jgi:hypothetical protein